MNQSVTSIVGSEAANFEIFRDCLINPIIQALVIKKANPRAKKQGRKRSKTGEVLVDENVDVEATSDANDLEDFVEYLAEEIFTSLAPDLRSLSFATTKADPALLVKYNTQGFTLSSIEALLTSIPPSVTDSLSTYSLPQPPVLLLPVLSDYITVSIAPPSVYRSTRTDRPDACEICERDWIRPLTYHHLIPRSVHAKVLKRGWHEEWQLNSVAWLCRACHNFVHSIASNEELARDWWSVELLKGREDVQKWAAWAGTVRWKSR